MVSASPSQPRPGGVGWIRKGSQRRRLNTLIAAESP